MIKVIDAICGAGKSTKMFQIMKDKHKVNPDTKFLYITPFLSEINERVPNEMPELNFKCPTNNGQGKVEDLLRLIKRGENISSTHVLFGMFTPEIVDLLITKQYVLVIDEAINCVGLLDNSLVATDTRDLLKSNMVVVDKENRNQVSWNEEDYPAHDGRYAFVRNLCNMGVVYCYADTFLMFEYPPKLLKGLSEVWILTYLFSGSDMRCWLDLHKIPYQILPHSELGLRDEKEIKQIVRDNLHIITNRSLLFKKQRAGSLSKNWFKNASKESIDEYRALMRSCVVTTKSKAGDVFWTTYKDYEKKMAGVGYTKGISPDMPAFLPMNIRATNDYRDYTLCMYAVNVFKNPVEVSYLDYNDITVDEDSFALSEMIQFIFRGAIRQGKPMKVLVLSHRMRSLLENWLEV